MTSTVIAALIGVGGSVLVAITSFLTTRAVTLRQLASAQRSRIWDKQAATYIDAISAVQWRQAQRNKDLAMIRVLGHAQEGGTSPAPVDWAELQGRLFAFASPEVLMAFKAASEAGQQAEGRMTELFALIIGKVPPDGQWNRAADTTDEIEGAIDSADRAAQAANDAEDALIDAIRADLHGEGGRALARLRSAVPEPTAPPRRNRQLSRSSSRRRQPLDRQVP